MVLSLLVLAIVGIVAYFHFIQGFFSAALSAFLAIIAAVVAVSFHEVLIVSLLQGKVAELAHSLVLVALFALTYIILRVIFDALVPGNVQVPLMVDRIGAGVMGVIAGIFAGGVFAVGAQALPFGPSVAGFSRFEMRPDETLSFTVPGERGSLDGAIYERLKNEKLDPSSRQGLLIPADSIVVGTTSRLSGGGALGGGVAWSSIHPDYLNELFYQKLGVQLGGKRVAYNSADVQQVQVVNIHSVNTLLQADSEHPSIKYDRWSEPLKANIKADPGNVILIVRVSFSGDAADTDGQVRLSPASVRLVAGGQNHLPLGTVEYASAPFLRANRPDDFVFVPSGGSADLVYYLLEEQLGIALAARPPQTKIGEGVFIEAKRLGFVSLAGREVSVEAPVAPKGASVLRKIDPTNATLPRGITRPAAPPLGAPTPGTPTPPTPQPTPDQPVDIDNPVDNPVDQP